MKVVERGRADFQSLLLDYDAENIFNLDELALFWKALPDRTMMVRKGEKGGKRSKSRITVFLITNMSGIEKLTPILIGKAKCPRCDTKPSQAAASEVHGYKEGLDDRGSLRGRVARHQYVFSQAWSENCLDCGWSRSAFLLDSCFFNFSLHFVTLCLLY